MYSRESQKYIYSLIKKFADENSLEMEKAKEILKAIQIVENSSSTHHITLQTGITDEKKNTILFFFHQQNIHDEQKMRA